MTKRSEEEDDEDEDEEAVVEVVGEVVVVGVVVVVVALGVHDSDSFATTPLTGSSGSRTAACRAGRPR